MRSPIARIKRPKKLVDLFLKDQIDFVASDHSPSPWSLKEDETNFFNVWGGISGGQFTLMAMIELAVRYRIPFPKLIHWTAARPAKRFGLDGKKGEIAKGKDADFVIISLKDSFTVEKNSLLQKHKHSLYVNHTFPCKIFATFQRGKLVFDNGRIRASKPLGQWLKL